MANWHGEHAVGSTHEWFTPPELFEGLGVTFDLDPAMPSERISSIAPGPRALEAHGGRAPVPWIPTRRWYTPLENGLQQPWDGLVWMNPPYGSMAVPFLDRLVAHGNGIALVFTRTETAWWHASAPRADAVLFLRDRLRHVRADGFRGRGAMASALLGYGDEAAATLIRADLAGWLVWSRGSRSRP